MNALLLMGLMGCQKMGPLGDALQTLKPTVEFNRLRTDEIDFEGIDATLVFNVDNPNPVALSLASMTYALDIEGISVLSGTKPKGFSLPASDAAKLRVPLSLQFSEIADLLSETRGRDELSFGVAGKMGFDTPIGEMSLPYQADGQFPVLRPPKVAFSKLRVKDLALLQDKATLALDLDVTNRGGAAITLADVDYKLSLAGARVASGAVARLGAVEADQTQQVSVPIEVKLSGLGSAIVSALTDRTSLNADFAADMSIDTPFGAVPLHLDESGQLQIQ